MGLRNPFRIDVDPATNSVSWGDYGPDAGAADPQRGPMGYVEWQTTAINKPINGGWPYCHGPNANYNEWNFATATPGPWFDCNAGAQNNSTWNTGLAQVPPATAPTLYYGDNNTHQPWPELTDFGPAGGQGPMGGPVYHFDAANPSTTKFPAYWDSKAFFAEFSQDYLAVFDVQWPERPGRPHHELPAQRRPRDERAADHRQPDRHRVRPGRVALRPRLRRRLLPGRTPTRASTASTTRRATRRRRRRSRPHPISSSTAPLTVTFDALRLGRPRGRGPDLRVGLRR